MKHAVRGDERATDAHHSIASGDVRTDIPAVALPSARVAEWQTRRV